MTFQKLGYVYYKPIDYDKFTQELTNKITLILGDSYSDDISVHIDSSDEEEIWLEFSKDDINYKNLIGNLITQQEYDALVENDANVILFY